MSFQTQEANADRGSEMNEIKETTKIASQRKKDFNWYVWAHDADHKANLVDFPYVIFFRQKNVLRKTMLRNCQLIKSMHVADTVDR